MGSRLATQLLALPVRHRDIELGRSVDLLLDVRARAALGLEVRCRDDVHRFLPVGAARIDPDAIAVRSPLILLDDLAFYRTRGSSFRALRGVAVRRAGRLAGSLADVAVGSRGALHAVRVETPTGPVEVPFGADVELEVEHDVSAA